MHSTSLEIYVGGVAEDSCRGAMRACEWDIKCEESLRARALFPRLPKISGMEEKVKPTLALALARAPRVF